MLIVDDDPAARNYSAGCWPPRAPRERGRKRPGGPRSPARGRPRPDPARPHDARVDGFDFIEALRREPGGPIPVVVLTAKDLTDDDRARLNGGVERIVQKGAYTKDALLGEVRRLLDASIARRRRTSSYPPPRPSPPRAPHSAQSHHRLCRDAARGLCRAGRARSRGGSPGHPRRRPPPPRGSTSGSRPEAGTPRRWTWPRRPPS